MRLTLSVVVGLLVTSLAVGDAGAAGWRVERSLTIAEHVWKPGCQVVVTWGESNPDDPTEVGWAHPDTCTITLRQDFPLSQPGDDYASRTAFFGVLCTILLHEVGHLAGAEHTDHGIMFPLMWRVDPRCEDRGLPYLQRAGLLPGHHVDLSPTLR